MKREQEIVNQMLELANKYNNIPCNYKECEECKKKKLCDLITEFVEEAVNFK